MQLFCPTCQAPSSAVDRCPRCGDRLVTAAEAYTPPPAGVVAPDPIRPTAPGRIVVGCLAALGLYVALRELAGSIADPEAWGVLGGWAVRAVAALGGGLLAGAGRRSGAITGVIVGLVYAGLLLAADAATVGAIGGVEAGMAVAMAVVAAVAGAVGGWVWPPELDLPQAVPIARRGSSLTRLAEDQKRFRRRRPTSWVRILIGAGVIVAGAAAADPVRVTLKKETGGILNTGGPAQASIADFVITSIVAVLGAAISGSGTGAGLRHGFLAGALAGFGVAALAKGVTAPVAEGALEVFGGTKGPMTLGVTVLVLSVIGGFLGSQVFPPLLPAHLRPKRVALS